MTSKKSADIVIPFLGDRDYLQGSSILESLVPHLDQAQDIMFKINDQLNCNRVKLTFFDAQNANRDSYSATLTWTDAQDIGNQKQGIGLRPAALDTLNKRIPFDESVIEKAIKFEDSTAILNSSSGYSFARCAVSTNKALLHRLLSPPDPGRWLFTRLNLDYWPDEWRSITISYRQNMRFQLVTSTLQIDGTKAGTMYFSWKSK